MTTIYFVRHCKPDSSWQDDRTRPLTQEGFEDSFEVARILKDKKIAKAIFRFTFLSGMGSLGGIIKK